LHRDVRFGGRADIARFQPLSSTVHSATTNVWCSLQISQRNSMVAVRGILFSSSLVALKFERKGS